ncbi:MAG TPA: hypothetical protein VFH89_12505 [Sphingomicrobium sp.]|nr:hypothetical protein [Sphingomicrobium sp.]
MSAQVLIAIAETEQNLKIQPGDTVDLHGGALGMVSGTVVLTRSPSLPQDQDKIFLQIKMNRNTPIIGLDEVSDIRVTSKNIFNEPVLSAAMMPT